MSDTQAQTSAITSTSEPDSNAALIGGIVGGIVALLLIGGLIAFLVARSRRNLNHHDNAIQITSTTPTQNNYNRIGIPKNNYNDRIQASSRQNYDSLTPREI
jgi:hypothetical protein